MQPVVFRTRILLKYILSAIQRFMIFARWRVPCYFHPVKKVGDLDKAAGLVQAFDLLGHNNRR